MPGRPQQSEHECAGDWAESMLQRDERETPPAGLLPKPPTTTSNTSAKSLAAADPDTGRNLAAVAKAFVLPSLQGARRRVTGADSERPPEMGNRPGYENHSPSKRDGPAFAVRERRHEECRESGPEQTREMGGVRTRRHTHASHRERDPDAHERLYTSTKKLTIGCLRIRDVSILHHNHWAIRRGNTFRSTTAALVVAAAARRSDPL